MSDEPKVSELDAMVRYGRGHRLPVPRQFALHERGWQRYKETQRREAEAAAQANFSPYAAMWRVDGAKK